MENFRSLLLRFDNLPTEQLDLVTEQCKEVYLKKGEYFQRQGEVCKRLGFISEGVLRIHYFDGENEITRYFLKENQFAVLLESFSAQISACEGIQAITDCKLVTLSFERYQWLCRQFPSFELVAQRITQHALLEKLHYRSPLVVEDAMTRYENFVRQQPDLLQRVPLGYIASYLGITQQSLSRLRKSYV